MASIKTQSCTSCGSCTDFLSNMILLSALFNQGPLRQAPLCLLIAVWHQQLYQLGLIVPTESDGLLAYNIHRYIFPALLNVTGVLRGFSLVRRRTMEMMQLVYKTCSELSSLSLLSHLSFCTICLHNQTNGEREREKETIERESIERTKEAEAEFKGKKVGEGGKERKRTRDRQQERRERRQIRYILVREMKNVALIYSSEMTIQK